MQNNENKYLNLTLFKSSFPMKSVSKYNIYITVLPMSRYKDIESKIPESVSCKRSIAYFYVNLLNKNTIQNNLSILTTV